MNKIDADFICELKTPSLEYKLIGRGMDPVTKAQFQDRFLEIRNEIASQYAPEVENGKIERDKAKIACLHEVLVRLAKEFRLPLVTYFNRE